MQRGLRVAIKLIVTLIGLLGLAAVTSAAVRVLPVYVGKWQFSRDISTYARMISVRQGSTDRLRDAIFQAAQRESIPIKESAIKIEPGSSGTHIAVDYVAPVDFYFFRTDVPIHVQSPEKREVLTPFHRFGLSVIGFLAGIYWFFSGFILYWKFRLISDTSLTSIRGVAIGLVQIHGKARGEKIMTAPVSHQHCFLYKVDIDRWTANRGGSGRWVHCMTDTAGINFYLEDDTGRILIDPQDAEVDLREICKSEVSKNEHLLLGQGWKTQGQPPSGPGLPVPQTELRSYLRQVESGVDTGLSRGKDSPGKGFSKSNRKEPRRGLLFMPSRKLDVTILTKQNALSLDYSHSPGDYRLTEYCIVPEETYDVTGTCSLNPNCNEGPDRQIVAKGDNAPTFLISDKSNNDLKLTLSARARFHILGGGLLAVGSAAALLETLGLLF
jgi:hypothetical protein